MFLELLPQKMAQLLDETRMNAHQPHYRTGSSGSLRRFEYFRIIISSNISSSKSSQ